MIKHGLSKTVFNRRWYGIRQRCNNINSASFVRYGGAGVKCLWKTFEEFKEDMYESYLKHVKGFGIKNTTIDRIDSLGNYSKENCRWATWEEQNLNKKNSNKVTFRGKTMSLSEWARYIGIKETIIFNRFHRGWNTEKILTTPDTKGTHSYKYTRSR